jgi:plastocyanin
MKLSAILIAGMLSLPLTTAPDQEKPRVHTVMMEGMRFQPEGLSVAAGDTVVWINRDMVPHTATSATGEFDSDEIAPGKSWIYTIRSKGEFSYVCTYHPNMKAVLRVK